MKLTIHVVKKRPCILVKVSDREAKNLKSGSNQMVIPLKDDVSVDIPSHIYVEK